MSDVVHKKAMFLTVTRPLSPSPPLDSTPRWSLGNTLCFFDEKGRRVWRERIPEGEYCWKAVYQKQDDVWVYRCDEFGSYFQCEVFKDDHFGWQLKLTISHHDAEIWHEKMMKYIREYHETHFSRNPGTERMVELLEKERVD